MREPTPGATAPARTPNPAGTLGATSSTLAFFGLSTNEWTPGGPIPERFSCDGEGISPALTISTVPADTTELVLVVNDSDADGYVHWLVTGIAPTTTEIAESQLPPGAVEHKNSAGKTAWSPPCPPKNQTHSYNFILYALSSPSNITPSADPKEAVATISDGSTDMAILTGTYERA